MIFVKRIKDKEKSTDVCPVYTYYGIRIEKDQTMGFFTFRDDLWKSWTGDFKEPVTREGWTESERIQANYEKAERWRWENAPEDLTDCLMSWEGGCTSPCTVPPRPFCRISNASKIPCTGWISAGSAGFPEASSTTA